MTLSGCIEEGIREVYLLLECRHPNILFMLGYTLELPQGPALVMERSWGSVSRALRSGPLRVLTLVERFDIEPFSDFSSKWSNFIRLVLCCIDAKICKKIFVGKLLTRSTRFTCFCTAQTSIFQKMFVKLFSHFLAKIRYFWIRFTDFCSDVDEILSEFRR